MDNIIRHDQFEDITVEDMVELLDARADSLEEDLNKLADAIDGLDEEFIVLDITINEMQVDISSIKEDISYVKRAVETLEGRLNRVGID